MTEFTPLQSLFGGGLIGVSAVMLMATLGRIAGITGIVAGLMPPTPVSDWAWRVAFLAGAIAAPAAYIAATGTLPAFDVPVPPAYLLLGGIIVGLGVTFGAGCTSGHGVCGLARLSPRSLVATATFMTTAIITLFVMRHVLGA